MLTNQSAHPNYFLTSVCMLMNVPPLAFIQVPPGNQENVEAIRQVSLHHGLLGTGNTRSVFKVDH